MKLRPLSIGIDNFETMIQKQYYYVDKTLLIRDLLEKKSEVNLFTRPRRFGKTLSVSMLQHFFENTCDEAVNERNAESAPIEAYARAGADDVAVNDRNEKCSAGTV